MRRALRAVQAAQAWMHEGLWHTDKDELEAVEEYAPPIVYDAIEVEIRKAQGV